MKWVLPESDWSSSKQDRICAVGAAMQRRPRCMA
jgi:hypothetical protein